MPYTTPTTLTVGQILTAAIWNASVRDDILYLQSRSDNPTSALVYHNTTQSIATATDTAVAFNSETFDTGMHSTVTNNSRLTVPAGEAGNYLITATVEFVADATGQRKLAIRIDGVLEIACVQVNATGGGNATKLTVAGIYGMNAAGYIEAIVSQNTGGSLSLASLPRLNAQRLS